MATQSAIPSDLFGKTKTYQVLDGYLPPKNAQSYLQLSNTYSAVLYDANERDVAAFVAVHKYAPTLAYLFVTTCDETLGTDKRVRVEEVGAPQFGPNARAKKIVAVKEGLNDLSKEPLWKTHFVRKSRTPQENVVDMAIIDALGSYNLELKKNVTLDMIETENFKGQKFVKQLDIWRDRVGFYVLDPRDFYEMIIPHDKVKDFVTKLATTLPPNSSEYPVKNSFSEADLQAYDRRVTSFERDEYLSYLRSLKEIKMYMAYSADGGGIACGTAAVFNNTVMHLYSESDAAALCLMKTIVKDWGKQPMTISTPRESFLYQVGSTLGAAVTINRIHRFHTVAPPAHIKWESVHAFNCGVNIV